MTAQTTTKAGVYASDEQQNYGLRAGVLGPVETLAQSVSAVAPSTSPSLTIPLVFAMAGNATWFVYLAATCASLLIGFCVSRFARLSASPGSLYSYTADTLPPVFGAVAAWALLAAYLGTGASVAGGALYYAMLLGRQFFHFSPPAIATLAVACATAAYVAWRGVKLSAQLMLWVEAVSVGVIVIILAAMPIHFGLHLDMDQLQLKGVSFPSLGPALVLAIFSFAGFESATTLGSEARDPLRTIPRAVIQCALLLGVFFMFASYAEAGGMRGDAGGPGSTSSPLHLLAAKAGVAPLGTAIDLGAFVSMLACVLACTTAAARVLLQMAHDGLLPAALGRISRRRGTPALAVVLSAAVMFAATVFLFASGKTGSDMYDLAGSLAVFGYLTAYALVAAALPFARRSLGQHSRVIVAASIVTVLVTLLIVVFDLESTPDPVHARIPYLYLAYMAAGLVCYALWRKKTAA